MRTTSPILNPSALLNIEGRDGLFFCFGLFTGMRQAEITSLKWGDVLKDKVTVLTKRKKLRTFPLTNHTLKEKIKETYKGQPIENYIFTSINGPNKPLTRKAVGDIVRKHFYEQGIKTDYNSSHSLRKTFGRWIYENYGEVEAMKALGHESLTTTMRYIGVTKEQEVKMFEKVSYADDPFYSVPGLEQYWNAIRKLPNARITVEQFVRSFLSDESQVRMVMQRL